MKPIPSTIFIILLVSTISSLPAHAATIYVPTEEPTIQAGIDAAVDGDLVLVAPGTYFENIGFPGRSVTVRSEAGSDVTRIDGSQVRSVVVFPGGGSADMVLDGFTIANGTGMLSLSYFYGGGISCFDDSPTIANCTITGNSTDYGGGINCFLSSPTIANCTISNNTARYLGGGIVCSESSPRITSCTISKNSAYDDGGGEGGGGIYCHDSSPTITNCTISENMADSGSGGGIFCYTSSPTITNSTIAGNVAASGGGIYCGSSSSNPVITNCTIIENWADSYGGGIRCSLSSPTIRNSILWGDNSPSGPEISVYLGSLVVTYSDIQGGWPGQGNIDADPLFLGEGDFHVTFRSPCIDTGTDAGVYTDIDGETRPMGFGFDMGIDEYPACWDGDDDGYGDMACGGYDCDDTDPGVNPGIQEICDDGIDDDCDGFVDYPDDPDCEFTLELEDSYEPGLLSLDFTLRTMEEALWSNYLILTYPTFQFIPLWTVPLPVIDPPIELPISFPFPNDLQWVGIWSGLFTAEGAKAVDLLWDLFTMELLPDTGIELCYDYIGEISCPAPGEPFYGQDAQCVSNPMSFTYQGDGTVTDNVTGLMWQQTDDDVARVWEEALAYCEALDLAGHSDWRLPDMYELHGIVDYGRYGPTIDTAYFLGTALAYYWSSSTNPSGSSAWIFNFGLGGIYKADKDHNGYVRCVRGETTTQSFTDHGDGTVNDNMTGLMWQQTDDGVARGWEEALAYCEALDLAGHLDWRLPDIKALMSIVDNTWKSPSIDPDYFPGTIPSSYWSSSTDASNTIYAWGGFFLYGGFVDYYNKTDDSHVRCVR